MRKCNNGKSESPKVQQRPDPGIMKTPVRKTGEQQQNPPSK